MTSSKLLRDPVGFLWDAVNTRGVRLTLYLIIVAALFPSARFILAVALIVTLAFMWARDFHRKGSHKVFYLAAAVALMVAGYVTSFVEVTRVDKQRVERSPWGKGIEQVRDGKYIGVGEGFRGPIQVAVTVANQRITAIETLKYPDLISVKDNEVAVFVREILETGRLERPAQPGMLRGATETLTGYANAVAAALADGIPDYPKYTEFSSIFLNSFLGVAPNRVTLNALAILFAAFMVFDYALQSMLTPGTGRSINCYNCATCVGACPVKEAEGVQMPMGLILLTRLGEYERVMQLSKYCVGCGRCAAKCPIGNSGPLVISAAFQACYQKKQAKNLKQHEDAV